MNVERNNKKLDELISGTIGRDRPKLDFNKWQINHKSEIENFKSQTTGGKARRSIEPPYLWSIIMKSSVTKLAAAATIILIASVSIFFLDKSVAPVYGITDMPGLFEQAKVIHIQGMQYFGSNKMPDGSEIPPVPIDNWIDLENGRSRFTQTGLSMNKDSVTVTISESISEGEYLIIFYHTGKEITFFKKSRYQQMLDAYGISQTMHQQIFGNIEQLQNFERIGTEQIDGVTYDIWEGQITGSNPIFAFKNKYWISPATGKMRRIQTFSKFRDGQWYLEYDYSKIEYDVEIPDEIFSIDVPEDYELRNTKETAIPLEMSMGGGGIGDDKHSIRANIMRGFRMPDDCIIAGWFSIDDKSEIPQEDFFTGLEFGGALPALPMEIYGLKPAVMYSDLIYTGYHLTFTKKNGKFFEWSLYVPNNTPSHNVQYFAFNALSRFNLDTELKGRLGLSVDCSILIENADDFDKWVLGAMAELSDEGMVPEEVTYEKVLELAQKIRKLPTQ